MSFDLAVHSSLVAPHSAAQDAFEAPGCFDEETSLDGADHREDAESKRERSARSAGTPEADRAFARALAALAPDLRARALRLCRDGAAADDLVQDAIERALRFRAQFQPGTNLRSWAQTIVFSVFVTGYRRRRREREAVRALTVDPCAWTLPEGGDAHAVEASALEVSPPMRRALDTLPAAYREILMLVDVSELSYRDAAAHLRIPVGTVMSRLHRARKQLAGALGHDKGAPPLAA
jgi:RNA polymerase sigma-70 factor (ECF subfamily)